MFTHYYSRKQGQAGFSLLELMVVMVIFCILLTIAAPSFIGQKARLELKRLTREIVSDMQLAKINALKTSSTWIVQFDTANSQYRIHSDDGADGTWNTADDTIFKTVRLSDYPENTYGIPGGYGEIGSEPNPGEGVIDGISFANNRIFFNSNGTSVGGTVYISNNNNEAFAIGSTSAAGGIKTWRNFGNGWEG
jgi:prepilin-type N-terminal cleavage/methylation domain-containing protein